MKKTIYFIDMNSLKNVTFSTISLKIIRYDKQNIPLKNQQEKLINNKGFWYDKTCACG
ncbi:hypothetical protein PDY_31150 [Photobacterium damselae subsp. damselae]|nr:hypothetical protein PDY_31150 [Photobacterium damselae subsp. damselae]